MLKNASAIFFHSIYHQPLSGRILSAPSAKEGTAFTYLYIAYSRFAFLANCPLITLVTLLEQTNWSDGTQRTIKRDPQIDTKLDMLT